MNRPAVGFRPTLPSVTRISDLDVVPYEVAPRPRASWRNGEYVLVGIEGDSPHPYEVELPDGRLAEVVPGDQIIGVLGRRAATLQVVGDWESVEDPADMDLLSVAGVVGRCTSRSAFAKNLPATSYVGHIVRGGSPVTMGQFAGDRTARPLRVPVVLIIGTSMDAGKTMAASRIVRVLRAAGRRVAGAKFTGVGRYRDVLAMRDAGAEWIFDFVDAGLPSSVVPPDEYEQAACSLINKINAVDADVAVIEAGASPLEPYNGDAAVRVLGDAVRTVVLCASDPYAAVGVISAFGIEPSFVAGRATSTSAGASLTTKLTGRPALDLLDRAIDTTLGALLARELGPARNSFTATAQPQESTTDANRR